MHLPHRLKALLVCCACFGAMDLFAQNNTADTFLGHVLMLDAQHKLLPATAPNSNPYDYALRRRWEFVKHAPASPGPAPRSNYPQYFFYCAWKDNAGMLEPDGWMNDVLEKIPNWFESARLFYAYAGDLEPMTLTKRMVDYLLEHGMTPASYRWPGFPQSAANAGETEFRGFSSAKRFSTDDVQVDHAGDMGATFYKMYLFYKDDRYKKAAIQVANVLAGNVGIGDATHSPWPYVVNTKNGRTVSEYCANWFGCIRLFDMLIAANTGDVKAYKTARKTVQDWLLKYPVQNGLWVDGHTDNFITGTRNLSNMSASNAGLYLSDNTQFDPDWKTTLPGLIKWTEDHFVFQSAPGEPSTFWGANIVSEQVDFMPKMDYQTARYAAQCARWYAFSGDESYKEKAFRALNFVTYCSDSTGKVVESPFSKGVNSWWSDSYGECPRMFYHVFAAIPEWAPAKEDHILYSDAVLTTIKYGVRQVKYASAQKNTTEFLRLSFKPSKVSINGVQMAPLSNSGSEGYLIRDLGQGDYAVTIKRKQAGTVSISGR